MSKKYIIYAKKSFVWIKMIQIILIEERLKRPLPIGKNKKVTGLFKDELGGKIITEFVALRPKAYAYLDDYGNDHKKAKGTKKCNKTKTYVSKF